MADGAAQELESLAKQKSPDTIDLLRNNPLVAFSEGAYSYPHDWWLGIHWMLGMQGAYGSGMKAVCERIGNDLVTMLDLGIRATPLVYQMTAVTLRYLLTGDLPQCPATRAALERISGVRVGLGLLNGSARFGGRIAGGIFTLYASTGGRFGKLARKQPAKTGFLLSNLMFATMGSLVKLAINTRGKGVSLIDMWIAVLTGKAESSLNNQQYIEIFRAMQDCAIPIDRADMEEFGRLHSDIKQAVEKIRQKSQ